MKITFKMVVLISSFALLCQEAIAAIEFKGEIPPGGRNVVILKATNQKGATDTLKFKFSAPLAGAYSINFCIGPETNPCGMQSSYVVTVPAGEERIAVMPASALVTNILSVGQGTASTVPFSVTVE